MALVWQSSKRTSPGLYKCPRCQAGKVPASHTLHLATNSPGLKIRTGKTSIAYSVPGLNTHAAGMT